MNKKEIFWWDIGSTLLVIGMTALLIVIGPQTSTDVDLFWSAFFLGMFCIGGLINLLVLFCFDPQDPQRQQEEVGSITMSKDKFLGITMVVLAVILGECALYLLFIRPFGLEGDSRSRCIALGLLAGLLSIVCGQQGIRKGNLDASKED